MPAHGFSAVRHFHGEAGVQAAGDDPIVADGPIAVEAHARQMHHQGVARHRRLHVERPSLWISSQDAGHTFFVGSASVHSCCVNGVSRRDGQHRLVRRGKLAVKRCGDELVPSRWPRAPLWRKSRCERMCFRTSRVACIRKHECPGHGSLFQSGRALLRPALLVFGNKMDGIARDGSLKLVAAKISCKFSRLLLQMHLVEKRGPVNVHSDDPSA